MALVCDRCSRVNPPEAAYCYHDGAALAGRAGGPIHAGSAAFPSPFVFPGGQACRNFDQLAMTCQQNWSAALDLLRQGFLASFFGGLGRVDLAVAAQEAAKFPDPDRGLDQLLEKLPTQVLEAPRLHAEPTDISLGQIPIGTDRTLELHLRNSGMRLLYGSVASDAKWLTLGEPPGQPQKVFQFGDEATVVVQVRGQHLRAGTRPLEGRLVLDSNGGTVTVTVRADVPVTPFQGGLFDGAVTPRQVAEKAKANPKDAAPYFEDGRVAAWFASNGWTYPVQGPPMSGMGAVQQFFEALGVAKPPRVEVAPPGFQFEGEPGKVFHVSIEVSSPERKVVYGWATADKPWVEVGKTKLAGRSATVPVTVTVPDRKGTQEAKLTVLGNGQQKFIVPVTVAVIGGADILDAEVIEPTEVLQADLIGDETAAFVPGPTGPSAPAAAAPAAPAAANLSPEPTVALTGAAPATIREPDTVVTAPTPPPLIGRGGDATVTFADGAPGPAGLDTTDAGDAGLALAPAGTMLRPAALQTAPRAAGKGRWMHFIPLGLLALALSGTCIHDAVRLLFFPAAPRAAASDVDPRKLLELNFDYNFNPKKVDPSLGTSMMAGLVRHDPEHGKGGEKKLTFGRHGHTNSLVLRIGEKDRVFGNIQNGRYTRKPENVGPYPGKICSFEFLPERVEVTQEVRIIPGEPVEVEPEKYRRLLDTCLFHYKVENRDSRAHDVGMRYLLDTYIGGNDGVPFTLPGVPGLVDTSKELAGEQVPDFVQVLENSDLKNPGLIAQLDLRLGEKYEPPGRVRLTAHPMSQGKEGLTKERWDIPLASIKDAMDSCVVLYWDPAPLGPGQSREMAFTYGLGNVSIGPSAKLGLTVGGAMLVGSDLTVVALVADPEPGQTVELQLPPELVLAGGQKAVQDAPPSAEKNKEGRPRPSPVTWRVRATTEGTFRIAVETRVNGEPVTQSRRVTIKRAKLF